LLSAAIFSKTAGSFGPPHHSSHRDRTRALTVNPGPEIGQVSYTCASPFPARSRSWTRGTDRDGTDPHAVDSLSNLFAVPGGEQLSRNVAAEQLGGARAELGGWVRASAGEEVSEQSGVRGSVPWSGTTRNGMPADRPYVWRRQGPVVRCPDHPGRELSPLPGGGARGICPVDGASYQMDTPEVPCRGGR
jgi:hypothetical protein